MTLETLCYKCKRPHESPGGFCVSCVVEARTPRFNHVGAEPVIQSGAEWQRRLSITHPNDESYRGDGT